MSKKKKPMASLNTPAINTVLEKEAQAMIDEGAKTLEDDWENFHEEPCQVCTGTGRDPDVFTQHCMACEGTGVDYRFIYGMSNGKIYSTVEQYGLDLFKEFCKARREAEYENLDKIKSTERSMRGVFALPQVLKFELQSRGYDVDEMTRNGEVRVLANLISKEYPEFLTTNLRSF